MKIEKSWTDIVFDGRNKAYGAYVFRKIYNEVVLFAMAISIFIFVFVWGCIFLFGAYSEINYDTTSVVYDVSEIPVIDNLNMPDYLKSPPPSLPEKKPEQAVAPVVTNDNVKFDSVQAKQLPVDSSLTKKDNEISGTGNDTAGIGKGFTVIEKFPSYPGGEAARKKFIRENIKLSKAFIEAQMKGTVYISFIVEKDGSITNVSVISGIGLGCDEEAVRVVKMMPKWAPGFRKGEPIRMVLKMPITFSL